MHNLAGSLLCHKSILNCLCTSTLPAPYYPVCTWTNGVELSVCLCVCVSIPCVSCPTFDYSDMHLMTFKQELNSEFCILFPFFNFAAFWFDTSKVFAREYTAFSQLHPMNRSQ